MYRLLVSGYRYWDKPNIVKMAIVKVWQNHPDLIIVHGDCPTGADRQAREFAQKYGVSEERYPARWAEEGKSAGPLRNQRMVDTQPDYAIFFMTKTSKGTRDCLERARKAGIPHEIYRT